MWHNTTPSLNVYAKSYTKIFFRLPDYSWAYMEINYVNFVLEKFHATKQLELTWIDASDHMIRWFEGSTSN